jgi:gliding motility-associated-like protein
LYTFTPTAGLCSPTTSMTITVNPNDDPNFTYVSGTYCLTGTDPLPSVITTPGGIFTINAPGVINSTTGLIDLGLSGLGGFTVTYNTPAVNLCPTSTTFPITITAAPSAAFTYDGPTYCQDATAPILTYGAGASGGVFTSVPGGLSLNGGTGAVDASTSTPGLYTVYNFIAAAGGCASALDSISIEILQMDSALFSYSTSTYCLTGTDPLAIMGGNSTGGGVFTITAPGVINAGDGTIDLALSGLGTYTVYYNTTAAGNPCPSVDSVIVTITAAPTAGFAYDLAQYCQDSIAPVLTMNGGASSGVFSGNSGGLIIDASGNITLASSTPGIYTVYNNVAAAGGCASALDSISIEVLQVDSALFSYSSLSYCLTETDPLATMGGNATGGGVFTITAPGIINAGDGTIDLSASGLGTYTVYYTTLAINSCPALDSLQVVIDSVNTINPNPVIPICVTDPLILSATSTGTGTITWYSDAAGTIVVGTGSPLVLINPGIGMYTYYVNSAGACSSAIDSVAVLVGGVNAVINATPISGAIPLDVFFGNGSTIGPGITYLWDLGDGNTSNIFEPSNTYSGVGSYTVTLIVSDGICSDTATIIIDAFGESTIIIPNVFTPNGDGSNDVFTVDGVNLESVVGEIYNRWGQKMFSWENVRGHWDGRTLSGSEAPAGTYFYIIKAMGFDGTEYFKKSGFSLVR